MAKATVKTSSDMLNLGNVKDTPLGKMITFGIAEIVEKGKAEESSSKAFGYALLLFKDPDERARFSNYVRTLDFSENEKEKSLVRETIATTFGASKFATVGEDSKVNKSQDWRNYVNRQITRLRFAFDVYEKGWGGDVEVTETSKGDLAAMIIGGSKLALMYRKDNKLEEKARELSPNAPINLLKRRSNANVKAGAISWPQFVEYVGKASGRNNGSRNKPVNISSTQPFHAVKAMGEVMLSALEKDRSDSTYSQFSETSAKYTALKTAENILGVALTSEDEIVKRAAKIIFDQLAELDDYFSGIVRAQEKAKAEAAEAGERAAA